MGGGLYPNVFEGLRSGVCWSMPGNLQEVFDMTKGGQWQRRPRVIAIAHFFAGKTVSCCHGNGLMTSVGKIESDSERIRLLIYKKGLA